MLNWKSHYGQSISWTIDLNGGFRVRDFLRRRPNNEIDYFFWLSREQAQAICKGFAFFCAGWPLMRRDCGCWAGSKRPTRVRLLDLKNINISKMLRVM